MGKTDISNNPNAIVFTNSETGRSPLPNSIHRQKRCMLIGRRKKGRGGVRFVVLKKNNFVLICKFLLNKLPNPQLLLYPKRHCFYKRPNTSGGILQICFKNPLKLQKWLIIKSDVVYITFRKTPFFKTIPNSVLRKRIIMLFSGKPLFLCGCNNFSVADKTSCAVMIKSRNS